VHDSTIAGRAGRGAEAPPLDGTRERDAELIALLGGLADPRTREEAAAAIARGLGGEAMLLFSPDPELPAALPAPGLRQTLRGASQWKEFLAQCATLGAHTGELTGADGKTAHAAGIALPDRTAAVLLGASSDSVGRLDSLLRPTLPLLGALFTAERRIAAGAVRAKTASDAVERGKLLTHALQELRERLQQALREADEARDVARERADQAELLATELQAQSDQLQQQAVELEILNDELQVRTEEAERAREAADAANSAKSQFLASMSHELRTPINAVIGYAELLNMGITGPVTEEQKRQLERIRASSAHLLSLVNDVLDLAKVEAGFMTVEHEHEPVAETMLEAISMVEVQASTREIRIVNRCTDPGAMYVGDRDRVRQILVNLLSNAVKFTDPGGTVTCECDTKRVPGERVELAGEGPWSCISVEDTGIGISAQDLPKIFQPFVQAESGPTRTRGGTGLGLTISRQLARLAGGDLSVKSEVGEGSRFTLWIPAVTPATGRIDPNIRVGAPRGGG
jgi:signal transduction histidine kinase